MIASTLAALLGLGHGAQAVLPQNTSVGLHPPSGATVLFDGKSAAAWQEAASSKDKKSSLPKAIGWRIQDGALEVTRGSRSIRTRQSFGDFRLHIEFWLPKMLNESGQGRANSGVYSHGLYEIQVLDSWKNPTYKFGGCGALYAQKDPDRDAIQPPETWNSYDIDFRAPRFDEKGKLIERPRITVRQNGILIHENVEIIVGLEWAGEDGPIPKRGPILLQNHGCPVRYRNIWIVPT